MPTESPEVDRFLVDEERGVGPPQSADAHRKPVDVRFGLVGHLDRYL